MPRSKASKQFRRNRRKLIERDKKPCVICVETDSLKLQLDHIKPVSDGGDDSLENLQVLCEICHRAKTARRVNDNQNQRAQNVRAMRSNRGRMWLRYRRKKGIKRGE